MILTWRVLFAGVLEAIPTTSQSERAAPPAARATQVLIAAKVRQPRHRHAKIDLLQTIIKSY